MVDICLQGPQFINCRFLTWIRGLLQLIWCVFLPYLNCIIVTLLVHLSLSVLYSFFNRKNNFLFFFSIARICICDWVLLCWNFLVLLDVLICYILERISFYSCCCSMTWIYIISYGKSGQEGKGTNLFNITSNYWTWK